MRALFSSGRYSASMSDPMCLVASLISLYTPAATAANIAAPKAQVCSERTTRIGMSSTSASVCITKGAFLLIPPMALTESMRSPWPFICSTIRREPKAVASTSARNISGALVPSVSSATAPFTFWSASGVRRPFIQSRATTPSSEGSMSWASRVSSTSMPSRTFCLASPPGISFSVHASIFLNQA